MQQPVILNFRKFLITLAKLERAKGFEPSTPTLARSCSTPELRPLERLKLGISASTGALLPK